MTTYVTPTQHEKNEWSRMAQDAYANFHNFYGHRYSAYASIRREDQIPVEVFDTLQINYRIWLREGWKDLGNYSH